MYDDARGHFLSVPPRLKCDRLKFFGMIIIVRMVQRKNKTNQLTIDRFRKGFDEHFMAKRYQKKYRKDRVQFFSKLELYVHRVNLGALGKLGLAVYKFWSRRAIA